MRRIAIIGGGIAGLTAAYELARLARDGRACRSRPLRIVPAPRRPHRDRPRGRLHRGSAAPTAGSPPSPGHASLPSNSASKPNSSPPTTRPARRGSTHHPESTGRLVPMPDGLNMFVPATRASPRSTSSPLFTPAAIAAYRAEPARAAELLASIPAHDESVADFTLRHFGPEVLARVAAPLLSGVFGGDVRTPFASAPSCPPSSPWSAPTARSSPRCRTHNDSGERATANLYHPPLRPRHPDRSPDRRASPQHWLRRNTTVTALTPPTAGDPRLDPLHRGSCNTQAPCLRDLRRRSSRDSARRRARAPHPAPPGGRRVFSPPNPAPPCWSPSASPTPHAFRFLPGFGFLVPPNGSRTRRNNSIPPQTLLLACTFTDQKFPHRVPPGARQVRAFFGGAAADRLARCNNDEIAAIARLEFARIFNAQPTHRRHSPAPRPPLCPRPSSPSSAAGLTACRNTPSAT